MKNFSIFYFSLEIISLKECARFALKIQIY